MPLWLTLWLLSSLLLDVLVATSWYIYSFPYRSYGSLLRQCFGGYADRPLEITLAAAEARPLHGPAKNPPGLALQAPVKAMELWGSFSCDWHCDSWVFLFHEAIVTGGLSFSMKPAGDRCMELQGR